MNNKIKALSITAIILFVLAVLFKSILSIIVTNVIVEDIITLQGVYNSNIDVLNYFYNNYIVLMKLEMIGLSIVLMAGCILIAIALFLKILRRKHRNPSFTKIIAISFSVVNVITITCAILSFVIESTVIYDIIRVGILIVITLIILDFITTFIVRSKSLNRTIYFAISIASVVALFFGVMLHFDSINNQITKNNSILEYHRNYIENYYEDYPDELKEELIDNYMYEFYEMHSSKGYLIGLNYTTLGAYKYMIARDNEFSLTTEYTVEEKALYELYIEEEIFNVPLLLSLIGGLIAAGFTITIGDGTLANRKKKVTTLLLELSSYNKLVLNGEMTKEEYNKKKKVLIKEFK